MPVGREKAQKKVHVFSHVPCNSTVQMEPTSLLCSLRVGHSFFGGAALKKSMLGSPALTSQQ